MSLAVVDGNANWDFSVWDKLGNTKMILVPEEICDVAFVDIELATGAMLEFLPKTCVMSNDVGDVK